MQYDDKFEKLIEYFARKKDLSKGIEFDELLWAVSALRGTNYDIKQIMYEELEYTPEEIFSSYSVETIMKHLHNSNYIIHPRDLEELDPRLSTSESELTALKEKYSGLKETVNKVSAPENG